MRAAGKISSDTALDLTHLWALPIRHLSFVIRHSPARAFTLVEMMIVVVLIGIITAMIIPEMRGTYEDAVLRASGRDLVSLLNLAYSRAVSLNQVHRVLLDETGGRYILGRCIQHSGKEDEFVPLQNVAGSQGELNKHITMVFRKPGEGLGEADNTAPPPPESGPDQGPPETAITFYPDGTADGGEIELTDSQGFQLVLRINPITAQVGVLTAEQAGPETLENIKTPPQAGEQ
jgi:prepilin-type N-terminal cleavage/methylation domain-containing protein